MAALLEIRFPPFLVMTTSYKSPLNLLPTQKGMNTSLTNVALCLKKNSIFHFFMTGDKRLLKQLNATKELFTILLLFLLIVHILFMTYNLSLRVAFL